MPFISPSVAHLGLRTISVKARPEDLVPLLDGVSPSPALSGIVFPYMRDSTTSVAALKAILRRIAARTTTSNLFLRVEGRNARALDAEEKELSRYMTKRRGPVIDTAMAQFADEVRAVFPRVGDIGMHADY